MLKRRHRHLAGILHTLDGDGANQSLEGKFDQAFIVLEHPFAASQGRESSGRETAAIGLMAGGAVGFARVNLGAFAEEVGVLAGQMTRHPHGTFASAGEDPVIQRSRGGLEGLLGMLVEALSLRCGQNGLRCNLRQVRGSSDGFHAYATMVIIGRDFKKGWVVFELSSVKAQDTNGSGTDAMVLGLQQLLK